MPTFFDDFDAEPNLSSGTLYIIQQPEKPLISQCKYGFKFVDTDHTKLLTKITKNENPTKL